MTELCPTGEALLNKWVMAGWESTRTNRRWSSHLHKCKTCSKWQYEYREAGAIHENEQILERIQELEVKEAALVY
jgi:hypothetical protein